MRSRHDHMANWADCGRHAINPSLCFQESFLVSEGRKQDPCQISVLHDRIHISHVSQRKDSSATGVNLADNRRILTNIYFGCGSYQSIFSFIFHPSMIVQKIQKYFIQDYRCMNETHNDFSRPKQLRSLQASSWWTSLACVIFAFFNIFFQSFKFSPILA